jgi:hypothetical protein
MRMKQPVSGLLSIGVGCALAMFLLEIGLRLKGMGETRVIYHEVLGKVYREDISNTQGFLTPEFPDDFRNNKLRIVLLGDSFTVTSYLPKGKRFGEQLTNALKMNNAQVFNLAVDGYGTNESLLAWKLYGLSLNPAISVYNFYMNDIRDNMLLRHKFTVTNDGIVSHLGKASWKKEIEIKVRLRSALANQLYEAKEKLLNRLNLLNNDAGTLNVEDYVQVERYLLSNKHDGIIDEEWNLMALRLKWWTDQNRAIGSIPILVYTPTRDEVDITDSYADLTMSYPATGAVQARLKALCENLGCLFFDLTAKFIEAERSGHRLYLNRDPHWNSEGVQFGAGLLANYISPLVTAKPK